MSLLMPENEEDMLKIDGVTKSNFDKFGEPLLEITRQAATEKSGKNTSILLLLFCQCQYIIIFYF